MKQEEHMTDDPHPSSQRLIFCCSGASKVGILSFQAAIRLVQEGFGAFSCIAGIGSRNPSMIRKAKSAAERMVIDGCRIGCAPVVIDGCGDCCAARKLKSLCLTPHIHIIATEEGIEKNGWQTPDSMRLRL